MKQGIFVAAAAALSAASCGGRVANPIPVSNSFDEALSCTHLAGELDNNRKRLAELTGESETKVAENIGYLISLPLFIDLSQSQKTEAQAIDARNVRLMQLSEARDCGLMAPPEE